MACFIVPMVLAIITSLVQKVARNLAEKIKLWILNALLWGGVALLAVEHAWHGEIVPWPPFLTAMTNPINIPTMLHEMLTIGVTMSVTTLAIWGVVLAVSHYMQRVITLENVASVKRFNASR